MLALFSKSFNWPLLVAVTVSNLVALGVLAGILLVPSSRPVIGNRNFPGETSRADDSNPANSGPVSREAHGVSLPAADASHHAIFALTNKYKYQVPTNPAGGNRGVIEDAPYTSESSDLSQGAGFPSDSAQFSDPLFSNNNRISANSVSLALSHQATAQVQAQAAISSMPLSLSTSADGATPGQAAALGNLQNQFDNTMNAQPSSASDAAYALAWHLAKEANDSSFEQQFGADAFIAAQLAQVHGGAK